MKLIVCITFFNGEQFLQPCVEHYLKFVDEVVIAYQDRSHKGERRDIAGIVKPLYADHPRVIIDFYKPNLKVDFKENERKKHNQMISVARDHGATHYIISAVDHFYKLDEVEKVREKAQEFSVTFTHVDTYYKYPTWQLEPKVPHLMPFICKMYPDTKVTRVANYPVFVDPAVQVNTYKNWHLFDESEITVHNYSMIRTDIREKYINRYIPLKWGASKIERLINEYENYDINVNPGIEHYHGKKIKIVPNYFDL